MFKTLGSDAWNVDYICDMCVFCMQTNWENADFESCWI